MTDEYDVDEHKTNVAEIAAKSSIASFQGLPWEESEYVVYIGGGRWRGTGKTNREALDSAWAAAETEIGRD